MNNKRFYQKMLHIAIPVSLQALLSSFLNTLDTIMISSLGDASIAGVGLANQVFFFFTLICFGINTGSSTLFAQFWGKQDKEQVQRVNQMSLSLGLSVALIFTFVGFCFPYKLVQLFISDPQVIQAGGAYLRVATLSYAITALSLGLGAALRSTGNPRAPLVAVMISFGANAFFNYVLIFGKFGAPTLGVVGAAWGTFIARVIEVSVLLYVVMKYRGPIELPWVHWVPISKKFIRLYIKTTLPVIINETFWSLGQVLYSFAYAMAGTQATAAIQVAVAVQNLAFVVIRGLSSSCTIMIGNAVGRAKIERAKEDARRFLILTFMVGVVMGVLEATTSQWTLQIFGSLSQEVFLLGQKVLLVMGFVFVLKAVNSTLVVGVLRGGGDTQYSMLLEMSCVWLVGVPLSLLGAAIFHLPVMWIVLLAGMEEVVKIMVGLYRVHSNKWIHILTAVE